MTDHFPRYFDLADAIPSAPGERRNWSGLHGLADSAAIAQAAADCSSLILIVTRDSARAQRWRGALEFFLPAQVPRLHFPDWETLPYDAFSPHQDIISERLATLAALPQCDAGVITVPITTLMQRIAPASYLGGSTFDFKRGALFDPAQQRLLLDAAGYLNTDTVTERGQYAVRGSVMDIFPMGAELPVRIDLLDDEIDTLRTFDPDTQRTVEQIEAMHLLPAKEFPFDEDAIARFRDRWHNTFNVDVRGCSVYQDVSSYIAPNGIEYYLPFFFEQLGTLFDYLPENVLVVLEEDALGAAQHHIEAVTGRYESLRHDVERPILPPLELYTPVEELHHLLNQRPRVQLSGQPADKHDRDFATRQLPDVVLNHRAGTPAGSLLQFLEQLEQPALFVAESAGRREVFDEILRKAGVHCLVIETFDAYRTASNHCIAIADVDEGMYLDDLVLISEADVLGTRQSEPRVESAGRIIDPEQNRPQPQRIEHRRAGGPCGAWGRAISGAADTGDRR